MSIHVYNTGLSSGSTAATVASETPDETPDAAHDVRGLHGTPLQDPLLLSGELPSISGPLLSESSH